MVAIALDFSLVCKLSIKAVILHRVWLFPVESRVGNRDNLYVSKGFANAADFICGGWDVNRIALFGNLELLHIFFVDNVILGEVIARSDNANNNRLKLMLLRGIFLFLENARNVSNSFVQIFDFSLNVFFVTLVIFESTDNFLADIFKVKLR